MFFSPLQGIGVSQLLLAVILMPGSIRGAIACLLVADAARLAVSENYGNIAETLGTGISHRDLNTCAALAAGDRFLLGAAEDEPVIHVRMGMLLAARVLVCSLGNRFFSV